MVRCCSENAAKRAAGAAQGGGLYIDVAIGIPDERGATREPRERLFGCATLWYISVTIMIWFGGGEAVLFEPMVEYA